MEEAKRLYDEYINYDLAMLLKNHGFDEYCIFRYVFKVLTPPAGGIISWYKNSKLQEEDVCTAPSYYQILVWLREKHNLCIYILPKKEGDENWGAGVCYYDNGDDARVDPKDTITGETFEECLENAIEYCLTNNLLSEE